MPTNFDRRHFLKYGLLTGSALSVSACASLDRIFMGDSTNLKDDVVILGGGIAGLAAAYELKKNKIPFRVFEASSRLGGRIRSVQAGGEGFPSVDLGAEFFTSMHPQIMMLAKELNLEYEEIKTPANLHPHFFYLRGKSVPLSDLSRSIGQLNLELRKLRLKIFADQPVLLTYANANNYPVAKEYDGMTAKQVIDSLADKKIDLDLLRLLELQIAQVFGVEASNVSALQFIATLDAEGTSLISSQKTFKFSQGFSSLVEALDYRIQGVIPDYAVKMQRSLREIRRGIGSYELVFNTPKGVETYNARNVICTIPFSKLRDVRGLKELEFSPEKRELINKMSYGNHLKGFQLFENAFWKKTGNGSPASVGNFSGDLHFPSIWDSGRAMDRDVKKSVLSFERGGVIPPMVLENVESFFFKDLGRFYSEVPARIKNSMQYINWAQAKWVGGSKAYLKPNEYLKYFGVAAQSEMDGVFQFAGEHTSVQYPGTVEGAIETALKAARSIKI